MSITLSPLIKKDVPPCVLFLSGSGNSINLVKALSSIKSDLKNKRYLKTISLSAYGGGSISKLVDIALSFEIDDMEIAEDIQLIVFHYLKQKLIEIYPDKKENCRNIIKEFSRAMWFKYDYCYSIIGRERQDWLK